MLNENEILNFLELVAHKIKNPLHSMGLNLEALRVKVKKSPQNKSETLLKHIDIIQKEQQQLHKIIQAGIDYLRPGGQGRRPIRLDTLLAKVRQLTMPYAVERQIQLSFEIDSKCSSFKANPDEIQKALAYLIQNAIEASPKNGPVKVVVHDDQQELLFEIHDKGVGIIKNDAQRIANLYYTTKPGHLGMGLPLAKKFITENEGKIKMQSTAGRGTVVIISFKN